MHRQIHGRKQLSFSRNSLNAEYEEPPNNVLQLTALRELLNTTVRWFHGICNDMEILDT